MRVESLLRRYRVYKGKINGKILRQDIVLDEENRRVLRDGAAVELTETEFSILQYLAAQKGKVVSVNDIYETSGMKSICRRRTIRSWSTS